MTEAHDIDWMRQRLVEHVNAGRKLIVTCQSPKKPGDILLTMRMEGIVIVEQPFLVLREASLDEFIEHNPFGVQANLRSIAADSPRQIYFCEVTTD